MNGKPLSVGVLISGRGSNMVSLAKACAERGFPAKIALVLSNRPDVPGLAKARELGLETAAVDHTAFKGRAAFEDAMQEILDAAGVDFLCSAGFMRVLTGGFTRRWEGRMLNIHPSLLPAFRGVRAHEQALAAGVRISGCTVHYVTADLDGGPIIGQAAVPVYPQDTAGSLSDRILAEEHRLYPLCLRLVAEGRVRMESGRTVYAPDAELMPLAALPD